MFAAHSSCSTAELASDRSAGGTSTTKPTIVEVDEAGWPGVPLNNYLPKELAAILAISVRPEAQQRMQGSRIAILGSNVQGIVPTRVLCVDVRPMRKKVRHTLRVTRRPAS